MTFIKRKPLFLTLLSLFMFAPLFSPLKLLLAAEISEELKPAISGTGNFTNTVFFTAKDSVVYNFDNRNMELCGKATIDHEGTRVQAPKIVIDLDTSQLHAYGTKADSSRTLAEPAICGESNPAPASSESANVVLPWSICAMMQKLRRYFIR